MNEGTVCPECGKRQAHIHLGWLIIPKPLASKFRRGVLFTQLHCSKCGFNSLIVRYKGLREGEIAKLDQAIRSVFE